MIGNTTGKRSVTGILFMLLALTAAVRILSVPVSAQQESYLSFKKRVSEQLEKSTGHSSKIALEMSRKVSKKHFASQQEWLHALRYLESVAGEKHDRYHVELCADIARVLRDNGMFRDGYYFLYKARKNIETAGPYSRKVMQRYHEEIGLSYYYFQRFDEARVHFHEALQLCEIKKQRVSLLNTCGLINRDQGYIDSARIYFEQALQLANEIEHKPWVAVISGNLGQYYWKTGNFSKARELCMLDYLYSIETNQRGSAVNALSLLIEMDLNAGNTTDATKKLRTLESMIASEYGLSEYRVYYRAKTAVQEATGDYRGALESYRKVVLFSDTLRKRTDIENVKKTEFQIDFERKQAEVSLLQEKKKRDGLIIYGLILITLIIIIVFAAFLNMISKRRRREKEIAALKQQQIERELHDTEREMRGILSNLMEKNQLVEQLSEEITQFQSSANEGLSEEKLKLLDTLQSFTLLTDDDWLEFKKLFEKLNPNFFTRLLSHSPDLTNAEIRLVTLIKLNLSNLEMSRALGISPDSVRKTSLRLRKKLNIELHEELVKFILTL